MNIATYKHRVREQAIRVFRVDLLAELGPDKFHTLCADHFRDGVRIADAARGIYATEVAHA